MPVNKGKLDLASVLWIGIPAISMLGVLAGLVITLGLHIYNSELGIKDKQIAGLESRAGNVEDKLDELADKVIGLAVTVDGMGRSVDKLAQSQERMGGWVQNLALAVSKIER